MTHDAGRALPYDIQAMILARALSEDLLSRTSPLHADAACKFFQVALADCALEIEQLADQDAGGVDRGATGNERPGCRVGVENRSDDASRNEQQFCLARRARRPLVAVITQRGELGEDLPCLEYAQASFLFTVCGEYPDRA